jgi:DNA-binding NtrC family response regulator
MERLSRYGWPGNIRELQNVIERAAVLARGPIIEVELRVGPPGEIEETVPLNGTLEEVERAHIQRMLQEMGWLIEGKQGFAARLSLSPSTLRYRMQKLGIKRPRRPAQDALHHPFRGRPRHRRADEASG